MMKRYKKRIMVSALIISMCCGPLTLNAGSLSGLKNDRETLKQGTEKAKSTLNETRKDLSDTLQEVSRLDLLLDEASDEFDNIVEQLDITEKLLEETESELSEAVQQYDNQYSAYKSRVRYMYEKGTSGYLEVVLKADSLTDFLNRIEYVNKIAEYDRELTDKLSQSKVDIEERLRDTERQKREVEYLENQQKIKLQALENTKTQKSALVVQLTMEEQQYIQQVNDLEAESDRIEKLIKEAEAEAARKAAAAKAAANAASVAAYSGGKIGWPVPSNGGISSPYGNRNNPINGRSEIHTGIDIPANYGANIVASEAGTVISSGWNGGYGNAVVINHGNGLSTMYAHNSSLVVKVGDTVKKGQVIAKAGSTGYSTGNHCHFEVRINGGHTNPMKYLK